MRLVYTDENRRLKDLAQLLESVEFHDFIKDNLFHMSDYSLGENRIRPHLSREVFNDFFKKEEFIISVKAEHAHGIGNNNMYFVQDKMTEESIDGGAVGACSVKGCSNRGDDEGSGEHYYIDFKPEYVRFIDEKELDKSERNSIKTLHENDMEFVLKNILFPCHNFTDVEKDVAIGYVDVPCRIYLGKAPSEKLEAFAKEKDGEEYSEDCFFIEALVGRDRPEEAWNTSNWFLFYIDSGGEHFLLDDSCEFMGAWNYFKEKYDEMKTSLEKEAENSLDTKMSEAQKNTVKKDCCNKFSENFEKGLTVMSI